MASLHSYSRLTTCDWSGESLPAFTSELYTTLTLHSQILVHVLLYFLDPHDLRKYPGPRLAAFSDLWVRVA